MGIRDDIRASIDVKTKISNDEQLLMQIEQMRDKCVEIYQRGGKLLMGGNGGSAADAQHFAAEITCQYELKRKGKPALALHTDTSALTAWSNDYSYEETYARLVEAHGRTGDGLFLISTSGNSKNLIQAAKRAKEIGVETFGLLGRDGGALKSLCDYTVVIPSHETPRIQECHILVIHSICSALDTFFTTPGSLEVFVPTY
jgi:D-sedoheptulose 7-phosphate isomerase